MGILVPGVPVHLGRILWGFHVILGEGSLLHTSKQLCKNPVRAQVSDPLRVPTAILRSGFTMPIKAISQKEAINQKAESTATLAKGRVWNVGFQGELIYSRSLNDDECDPIAILSPCRIHISILIA